MRRTCYAQQSTFAPTYAPVRLRGQPGEEASSEAASPECANVHPPNPRLLSDSPLATSEAEAGMAAPTFFPPKTDVSAPVKVCPRGWQLDVRNQEGSAFPGRRKYTVRRRVHCNNGDVLVWLSNRWRGWGSEKRYGPPVAALYSGWHGNEWNEEGVLEAVKWDFEFGHLLSGEALFGRRREDQGN